jgi:hypothetical protein
MVVIILDIKFVLLPYSVILCSADLNFFYVISF